jgi:type IV secretory pathway VirJ component
MSPHSRAGSAAVLGQHDFGMFGLVSALVIFALASFVSVPPARAVDAGRYGNIRLVAPSQKPRGLVVLFSSRSGISSADQDNAEAIAKDGAFVAEVSSRDYLRNLEKAHEDCHTMVYDAEWLSRQIQRERHFPNYLTPIVAGAGEGGTLAELNLIEAPSATLAGAVSLDPSETVATRKPFCSDVKTTRLGRDYRYGAQKKLMGKWTVGLTPRAGKADREYILKLRREGAPLDLHEIAQHISAADALRSLIEPYLAKVPPPVPAKLPEPQDISGLPLAVLPVDRPSSLMVIEISGDGGWRDIDKALADDFQRMGIPVVGVDSLRYFWSKKTPAETAKMVAALIETFMAKWHADKVALVGYSFGADVMPFIYNRLPQNLRDHVVIVSLLGFSKTADFEISVRDWLGEPPGPDALPVLAEADKVPARLMQCIYGENESDTACPAQQMRGVETYRRSGGHHFDGNYDALADLIVMGIKQRTGLAISSK